MTGHDPETAPVRLPEQRVTRLVGPIARFMRIEAVSGAILLAAASIALIFANSRWGGTFLAFWATPVGIRLGSVEVVHSVQLAINEGMMTLFFFVVGLEIKRELVLGELREWRVAALPVAAALGGMLVPVTIYLALQFGEAGQRGWGVVMATDIAFVVGGLSLLGRYAPKSLRVFVLSLAIIDDIGAIIVIAVAYAANLHMLFLGLGILGVGCILALRYLGVRSVPVYFLVGIATWFAVLESGIHPTIIGVALGLLTPVRPWIGPRRFRKIIDRVYRYVHGGHWRLEQKTEAKNSDLLRSLAFATRETISPVERLETTLHPWVGFVIMPVFALGNAGVPLTKSDIGEPVALAVILGLVLGKPLGIFLGSWIAVRTGIAERPEELRWPVIAATGVLCGTGFTMSLFIASLAFGAELLRAAKLGVLSASFASAVIGIAVLGFVLRRKHVASPE